MTRWRLVLAYSILATLWAAAVGASSLLPDMAGLPEAVVLLAPVPAVPALALLSVWRAVKSLPPHSLPLWTRILWFGGLLTVLLVALIGGHYSSGDTRADLARFAPGWAFLGIWFGYNAVLFAWAKLREVQHSSSSV